MYESSKLANCSDGFVLLCQWDGCFTLVSKDTNLCNTHAKGKENTLIVDHVVYALHRPHLDTNKINLYFVRFIR